MRRLLLLAALAACVPALAAQAVSTSVEALARGADLVVRARVARTSARWSAGRIFTFVELARAAALRGRLPAGTLTVHVPGGAVGRVGQRVDGAPRLAAGDEVILFLARAEGGSHRVVGLAQGAFLVEGGTARPDLSQLELLASSVRQGERRAEAMPLAELERRVRSVP